MKALSPRQCDRISDDDGRPSRRLLLYLISFLALVVAIAACSAIAIHRAFGLANAAAERVKVNGPLYETIIRGKGVIADVLPPPQYVIESYLIAFQLADATEPKEIEALVRTFRGLRDAYTEKGKYWRSRLEEGELKHTLLEKARIPAERFYHIVEQHLIPAIRSHDMERARKLLRGPIQMEYMEHRKQIDEVVSLASKGTRRDEDQACLIVRQAEREVAHLTTLATTITVTGLLGCGIVAVSIGILAWRRLDRHIRELRCANGALCREMSERIRAEHTLRSSQLKYKVLYESSRDAIMLLAPERGFIGGNPAAIDLFRCKDERDFTSRTPADLSPACQPDGWPSVEKAQEMISVAMRHGSHQFEWMHKRTNGAEFFADVLLTRMEVDGKRLLQATVRDITAIKKAEQSLRQSEQKYRLFAENVTDVIWTMDLDGHYTFISPSIRQLLGYTVEEALQLTLEEKLVPHARDLVRERLEEAATAFRNGVHFPSDVLEVEQRRKNGTTVWTEVAYSGMYDESNALIGIQGITRDISTRKRLEAHLSENDRRLHTILDHTFEFIGLMSLDGTLLDANQAALAVVGAEAASVLNKPVWETPWWSRSPDLQRRIREATASAAEGEFVRMQITHSGGNGDVRWVDFSLKPLTGEEGNILYLLIEGRDITDLHRTVGSTAELWSNHEGRRAESFGQPRDAVTIEGLHGMTDNISAGR